MERRDFLKLASSAGLALAFPSLIPSRAEAAIDGPLFVFIHADGGWDPTSLCDPKGFLSESEENPMNKSYAAADIGNAGNIRFAPVGGNQAFFEKHHSKLLVVNGIDTETNSHDSGTRNTWSGRLGEGWPALSALIASVVAKSKPMAFLTAGGYDYTAGLVAPTRTGNLGALTRLAYPNRTDPNNPDIFGQRQRNVPENQVNLWSRYDLIANDTHTFGAALGMMYYDDRSANLTDTVTLPSFVRWDGGLYYRRGRLDALVYLENLFDEDYAISSIDEFQIFRGAPFNARAQVGLTF